MSCELRGKGLKTHAIRFERADYDGIPAGVGTVEPGDVAISI